MSPRLRLIVLILGLLLLVCGLAALVYALWPLGGLQETQQLAPTLFAPP